MNIKVILPIEKSSSRKVNKYVKLRAELRALRDAITKREFELNTLMLTMTGGQLGEAKKWADLI
jgi:hypothetical protein